MRKLSLFLLNVSLFLLLSASAFGQSTVVFSWSGDGNPSMPVCSTSVTASYLTGYTLTDVTVATAPVVISSSISVSTLTYSEPLPSVGSHTWSIVVNGKDQSGNSISSVPVTVTLTVPSLTLLPPTGFTGVP